MSKCYAVASGKGGVGKSAITANLAATLAENGSRVLIIDADIGLRSQDALLSLENRVVYDLIDAAEEECLTEQAVLSCESIPSLHLLPAAQFKRVKALDPGRFGQILDSLRHDYDYLFVDCPAGIERGLRNVLNAGVDETLLVVTPDDISIRSAERTAQIIREKDLNRPSLIVNRVISALIRSGEMMSAKTVSEILDLPLLGVIPEDLVFCRSLLCHRLLINYDCEARNAVLRIAARLQGHPSPIREYGRGRKRHFLPRRYASLREVSSIDNH